MSHWTWWQGALALATVATAHQRLRGRPLGVSGRLGRLVRWSHQRQVDAAAEVASARPQAFEAAMVEATLEAVAELQGPQAAEAMRAQLRAESAAGATTSPEPEASAPLPRPAETLEAHLAFALALAAGGLVGALTSGGWSPTAALPPAYAARVADGALGWACLFSAGVLVGFGTAMAGGCTSGHGLVGCARLQPASLVTTACFFATAALVSLTLTSPLTGGGP